MHGVVTAARDKETAIRGEGGIVRAKAHANAPHPPLGLSIDYGDTPATPVADVKVAPIGPKGASDRM